MKKLLERNDARCQVGSGISDIQLMQEVVVYYYAKVSLLPDPP